MPLYIKDDDVDRLAERVATLHRITKTEAVRRALRHELENAQAAPTLVERGIAFMRALQARGDPGVAKAADKAFIDSLYEGP
jgi:antitoxin VapB